VSHAIQERVVQYWTNVDADLGAAVAAGLSIGNGVPVVEPVPTKHAN
jgi:catalase